uniref:Non-specific lipid-transfer protein n=1 Tax=Tamarix hispida TaxID=189793 RepID=C0KHJ9_9CARY|nr:lipid transfer protein 2 [Tamarix hispida]
MAGSSALFKLACLVAAFMIVSAPHAEAAISCGTVVSKLAPCLGFLRGGGSPPPACCSGIRNLQSMARSTPDRQAACGCLKSASAGVNMRNAAALPGKCGVNIGYPISRSVDCSRVK